MQATSVNSCSTVTALPPARAGSVIGCRSSHAPTYPIVATLGYVGAWLLRHPMTLPARAGGKAVTVLQLLTLVACIVGSPHVRSIAWATTAVGLYAIWDYSRAAARVNAQR